MIDSIAELLEAIRAIETERIQILGIKHRPTIGNVFEGLTADLLHRAVFTGLNLNIIRNSFIVDDNGTRSLEFDVILIEGEGRKLPYTDQYDVKLEQVIAVIQVKKTLNTAQIGEAYLNLKNVYDHSADQVDPSKHALKIFSDAYQNICGESIIEKRRFRKTFSSGTRQQIFHILRYEATLPARIVFGYNGYTTESGLREGFVKFLSDHKSDPHHPDPGFGPLNYPDLIINGSYSLVKGNGMPYIGPLVDDLWLFYFSSSENPILKMLEIIWTRLAYRFSLHHDIFGEDLESEGLNLFLKANKVIVDGMVGWNIDYSEFSNKTLKSSKGNTPWEPVKLTMDQHHIIAFLSAHGNLRTNRIPGVLRFDVESFQLDKFIQDLTKTGLVYVNEQSELQLLTEQCQTIVMPDGHFYGADNKTGRLTRWAEKKSGRKLS